MLAQGSLVLPSDGNCLLLGRDLDGGHDVAYFRETRQG